MKRFLAMIISFALLICTVSPASATGTVIGDGGGGGMGGGTGQDGWNTYPQGFEAIRVSVVSIETKQQVGRTVDFSNISNPAGSYGQSIIRRSQGLQNKLFYMRGGNLNLDFSSGYTPFKPPIPMPAIIETDRANPDINTIKSYFGRDDILTAIAAQTGVDKTSLVSGRYAILLEPVAYFIFSGSVYALTATECGVLDKAQRQNGYKSLYSVLTDLTSKNLPLALFLDKQVGVKLNNMNIYPTQILGLNIWGGTTTGRVSDPDIISSLGIGAIIFSFPPGSVNPIVTPSPSANFGVQSGQYSYACDSDVITSTLISADRDVTCDSPATVTFNVNGSIYQVQNIVIPAGNQQRVWFKWHTPSTPQRINIGISVSNGVNSSQGTIQADVYSISENIPPDPTAKDVKPKDYTIPPEINLSPSSASQSVSWSVWTCTKTTYEVTLNYDGNNGLPAVICKNGGCEYCQRYGQLPYEHYCIEYEQKTGYVYNQVTSGLTLTSSIVTKPDSLVPTARQKFNYQTYETAWEMKSGYGVNVNVSPYYQAFGYCTSNDFTTTPYVIATFPEFNYQTYNRLLDRATSAPMQLRTNDWSQYNHRVHFTPLWYPDGIYRVKAQLLSVWTPVGEIRLDTSGYVVINGNLYDDYYVAVDKK